MADALQYALHDFPTRCSVKSLAFHERLCAGLLAIGVRAAVPSGVGTDEQEYITPAHFARAIVSEYLSDGYILTNDGLARAIAAAEQLFARATPSPVSAPAGAPAWTEADAYRWLTRNVVSKRLADVDDQLHIIAPSLAMLYNAALSGSTPGEPTP